MNLISLFLLLCVCMYYYYMIFLGVVQYTCFVWSGVWGTFGIPTLGGRRIINENYRERETFSNLVCMAYT